MSSSGFRRERIGEIATENLTHLFVSLATDRAHDAARRRAKGTNDHHRAEAAFKALALALRQAVALDGPDEVPSTKGVL